MGNEVRPPATCLILCAGPIHDYVRLRPCAAECSYVIAVDGGGAHLDALGVRADLYLGDFDSWLPPDSPDVIRLKPEKDETDTYSAALIALKRGFSSVLLLGATGDRLDHTLANVQTLAFLASRGVRAVMMDENHVLQALVPGKYEFPRAPGRVISIFALSARVTGVCFSGVKYPLRDAVLTNTFPIGISNEFAGERAALQFETGQLLCVIADSSPKKYL